MPSQKKTTIIILSALCSLMIMSCSRKENVEQISSVSGENFDTYFADEEPSQEKQNDRLRNEIGRLFFVEHAGAEVNETMRLALQFHPPAGLLLMPPLDTENRQIQDMVRAYSTVVMNAHRKPVLISADTERGVFKGMTYLAQPRWLGKIASKQGYEICHLHAQIMADELLALGINAPMSVVSDLAHKTLASRGISNNPEIVSKCLQEFMQVFVERKKIIFITQHFPGASLVQTKMTSMDSFKKYLAPFVSLIDFVKIHHANVQLSLVINNAKYPLIDEKNKAPFSQLLLKDMLRDKMQFVGLAISDGMWKDSFAQMNTDQLLPMYVLSILSGMDVLTIPGSKFAPAVQYFRRLYDSKLTDVENYQLEVTVNKPVDEIRQNLRLRINEILDRLQPVQKAVGHSLPDHTEPKKQTAEINERYQKILQDNYFVEKN